MIRFYLLPIERVDNYRGPAYFDFRGHEGIAGHVQLDAGEQWSLKDYGSIDMAILAFTAAEAKHMDLAGRSNVYQFPENLSPDMTLSNRQVMNTYLEAHSIPGDWLKQGDTFLSAARIIAGMFLYLQRVLAILEYPADPFAGLTLNTRYNQLTTAYQNAMSQAAADSGYIWDVVGNDQIRKIFKLMSDQWGSKPILFGFVTL